MAKIYKRSDRISVQIDDVIVKVAPLTHDQKIEVQQALIKGMKGDFTQGAKGVFLSLKYSIKSVKGFEDSDGNPYQLEFEGDGLADSCVDDLLNSSILGKLSLVCSSLVKNVPSEFTDNENKPLEGVRILKPDSESEEKNS